jgi:hypothetical protein
MLNIARQPNGPPPRAPASTPNQITSCKAQLEEGAADVFGSGGGDGGVQPTVEVKSLHAKIGRRTSRGSVNYLTPDAGSLPRDHLTARPAASGVLPFRRLPDVARPCWSRRGARSGVVRQDADAADGNRTALSPSAHSEVRLRPQDLPISNARCSDHAPKPGLGDGHHLYPTARGFSGFLIRK